jgi:hypothetical protein
MRQSQQTRCIPSQKAKIGKAGDDSESRRHVTRHPVTVIVQDLSDDSQHVKAQFMHHALTDPGEYARPSRNEPCCEQFKKQSLLISDPPTVDARNSQRLPAPTRSFKLHVIC